MRVHVYDFCEKAEEYAETKSPTTAVEETKAKKYDLDCLTQPIDKPLTECI